MKKPHDITTARPWFSDTDIDFITSKIPDILRGQLTMGKWVHALEEKMANMAGTRYALATNSCTSALEIALKSLGIGSGDEVLVPAQTFTATAAAVENVGATPVFCDICSHTLCLDPKDALERITQHTRAIILVHFAGLITPDLPEIEKLCRDNKLHLIEDAAHAHGAVKGKRPAGSIGSFGAFSYYATKVLTTGGEGGGLTTNDESLYKIAKSYQYRGQDLDVQEEEVFIHIGRNVRMMDFAALCGVKQHERLDEFIRCRNKIADRYNAFINSEMPECEIQICPTDTRHAFWKHVFILPQGKSRQQLKQLMYEKYGLPLNWSYYPPVHLQPVFQKMYGTYQGMLPVAERICAQCVNLPMNVLLTDEDVEYICESLLHCYKLCK